jgi:DNA-binding NarL/FixJ family response regulator
LTGGIQARINHLADVGCPFLSHPACMTTESSTAVLDTNSAGGFKVSLAGITLTVDGAQRTEPWGQTLLWVAQELRQLVQRETDAPSASASVPDAGIGLHLEMPAGAPPLTSAEQAVVRLVAQGLTNKQVAGQLYVSHRTVDSHVSHALAKLGLSSRVQLALLVASGTRWPG